MISQSLAHLGIAELQKAVLGMNPAIKPYAALAALQEKVKSEQMKQGQAMQNPAQPPVAQQMMAQAQQLSPAQVNNPYMASGLGAVPVQSPVQAPTANMASGGIIAFDEGGEVPRFQVGGAMTEREIEKERERIAREQLREQLYSLPSGGKPGGFYAMNVPTPTSTIKQEEAPPQYLSSGKVNPAYTAFAQRDAVRDRGVDSQSYNPAMFSNVNAPVAPAPEITSQVAPEAPKDKKETAPAKKPATGKKTKEDPVGIAQAVTDADRYKVDTQYKTLDDFMTARKAAEASAGTLPDDEFTKLQRENLTKREARLAKTEKSGDQLAYLQAAGYFFGPGNLLQNAQRGLPAFAEAKIKANATLDAAQEKVMDAQDAYARYNQARQDGNKKDARDAFGQYKTYSNDAERLRLTGIQLADTAKYQQAQALTGGRMADAAMLAAKNRGIMGGQYADRQRLAELKTTQDGLNKRLTELGPMAMLPENKAEVARLKRELNIVTNEIAGMAGIDFTMPPPPAPGAGNPNLPPLSSVANQFYTSK